MPTKPKLREDANETAFRVMREAVGEPLAPDPAKSQEAAKRGRKGGKAGGRARADALTPESRRRIAKKASRARWERKTEE